MDTVKEYIAQLQQNLLSEEKSGYCPNKKLGERQELLEFFHQKVSKEYEAFKKKKLSKSSLAFFLSHLKRRDLYYLKSICLDSEHRGGSFTKTFWGSLKPKKP